MGELFIIVVTLEWKARVLKSNISKNLLLEEQVKVAEKKQQFMKT